MGLETHRRLDDELVPIDALLRRLFAYAEERHLPMDWPHVSLSAKMAEWRQLGLRPDVTGIKREPEMPEDLALIDRLIALLPEIKQRAIKAHYQHHGHAPIEVQAHSVSRTMSRQQFSNLLNRALWHLRGSWAATIGS